MLFERQKQTLRDLVMAANLAQSQTFLVSHHPHDAMKQRAVFRQQLPSLPLLNVDFPAGTLQVLLDHGFVAGDDGMAGTLTTAAFKAVEHKFAEPAPEPANPVHVINQTINITNSTVGAVSQGGNASVDGMMIEKLLTEVRAAAAGNAVVLEQADNIADEVNTGEPQARKLKTYFEVALSHAQKNASIVSAICAVANLLGLGLYIQQHLGHLLK